MGHAERSPAWVEAIHLAAVHVDLTDSLSEDMPEPAASVCRARARTVLRATEEEADRWLPPDTLRDLLAGAETRREAAQAKTRAAMRIEDGGDPYVTMARKARGLRPGED